MRIVETETIYVNSDEWDSIFRTYNLVEQMSFHVKDTDLVYKLRIILNELDNLCNLVTEE